MYSGYHLSQFLHIVKGHGIGKSYSILYNSLSLGSLIVSNIIAQKMQQLKHNEVFDCESLLRDVCDSQERQSILTELERHRFIVRAGETEYEDYVRAAQPLSEVKIGILYLLVTEECNFRCGYCFVEGGMPAEYVRSSMTTEVASRALEVFSQVIDRESEVRPQIIFYGGEPSLSFDVVETVLELIKMKISTGSLPSTTQKMFNTNGSLIDARIAECLRKHDVTVALSLDGPELIHNLERRYHSGVGTFEDVIKAYGILRNQGTSVGISCTIGFHNCDKIESICEWMISNLEISSFGFNILIDSHETDSDKLEEYANQTAIGLIRCYELCRQKGVYEDRMMRRVRPLVEGYITYSDCGGCGQQIIVDPKGNIGVCHAFCGTKRFFLPSNDTSNPATHKYWKEWRLRSPITMPQCLGCIALGICGGGCPYRAFMHEGSIWSLDRVNCIITKRIIQFMLQDLIQHKVSMFPVSRGDAEIGGHEIGG